MSTSRYNVAMLKLIINYWFGFNIILLVVNCLPHWPVPVWTWANLSLYFLAFLVTLFTIRIDNFNRDVFIVFSAILFLYGIASIPVILTGKSFLFGSNRLAWLSYRYYLLSIQFFFTFFVVYYAAKYALQPSKPLRLFAATIIFVAAVYIYHFYPLLFHPSVNNYDEIFFHKKFTFQLLPIVTIFVYILFNPFFKPKHGEYTHAIMSALALLSLRDLAITISELKNVYLFGIDSIFLAFALVMLNVFLFKRFMFLCSPAGQIYLQFLHQAISIPNLKLEGRDKKEFTVFAAIVHYIYYRRHTIIPFLFLLLLTVRIINPPFIVVLNLSVIAIVVFLVVLFLIMTYNRKQKKDGFIITHVSN